MGTKARGRGIAATFGLLLVLAGIAGAIALWVMADRRPDQAVDGFARGPVGCTTTLEFSDTGTFYVYEERVGPDSEAFAACAPAPVDGAEFAVELFADGRSLTVRDDERISYDTATAIGTSIARVEIDEAGRLEMIVTGSDPGVVAAVGRDPQAGVDGLRRGAVVVGVLGVLLGSLMLLLAGRRSKRAAMSGPPEGPGWGPQAVPVPVWPPEPPRVQQQPVNPLLPPEPVAPMPVEPPGGGAPEGPAAGSPWAPPAPGERHDPPPA